MCKTLTDLFIEGWEDLSTDDKIEVNNIYCREEDPDSIIYDNDNEFFDENFTAPSDAVRAILFGEYEYSDKYVWFDGYANLKSTDFESALPFADLDYMAEWYKNNYEEIDYLKEFDDFVYACKFGIDEDDEEEEESE